MAGTDLAQYNGTPSFPSRTDVGTNADPYQTVTDGPVVTADSNAAGFAPVNISIKRVKDLLLGLRGATIGDFAGAAIKTFRSVKVDGTGGAVSTAIAGDIQALRAIISGLVSAGGDVESAGQVLAGDFLASTYGSLQRALLRFVGTATTGSNPPQGTSIKNQLRAINIPKCSAFIKMTTPGTIDSFDGYGLVSVAINGVDSKVIDIGFRDAFDNTNYTMGTSGTAMPMLAFYVAEIVASRTTTATQVTAIDTATGMAIDFAAVAASFSISFDGQQTT